MQKSQEILLIHSQMVASLLVKILMVEFIVLQNIMLVIVAQPLLLQIIEVLLQFQLQLKMQNIFEIMNL